MCKTQIVGNSKCRSTWDGSAMQCLYQRYVTLGKSERKAVRTWRLSVARPFLAKITSQRSLRPFGTPDLSSVFWGLSRPAFRAGWTHKENCSDRLKPTFLNKSPQKNCVKSGQAGGELVPFTMSKMCPTYIILCIISFACFLSLFVCIICPDLHRWCKELLT